MIVRSSSVNVSAGAGIGAMMGLPPVASEVVIYFWLDGTVLPSFPRALIQGTSVDCQHPAMSEIHEFLYLDMGKRMLVPNTAVDEFISGGFRIAYHDDILNKVVGTILHGAKILIASTSGGSLLVWGDPTA